MVDRLTPYQIALFKEQFEAFDTDGDGKLTKEDTAAIIRSLGQNLSEEMIAAKHNEFDKNGNGTVEFPEFLEAMAKSLQKNAKIEDEEIFQLFSMLDLDGDGYLNRTEISQGMVSGTGVGGAVREGEELSDEEVSEMLREYDRDGDGKLSLEEFAQMMKDEIYGAGLAPVPSD